MADLGYKGWIVQLVDKRKGTNINDDSGVCNVLTAGSPAEATIYSNTAGTAASNPLTFTDGKVKFYTLSTVASVDLSILTAAGDAVFIEGQLAGEIMVEVDTQRREQMLIIPFGASNNTVVDTGFNLPANMLLEDALMKVTTVDATETIEFGFENATEGGDLNGLIDAASVASAGYVELKPQITGGTNIDYVGTNYVGALLATSIAGADAVATVGGFTPKRYATNGTIQSLVYTGSAGSDTAAGYFMLLYKKAI